MDEYSVFYKLPELDNIGFSQCFCGEQKLIKKKEIILGENNIRGLVGIMHSGLAFLQSISTSGEANILNYYEKGDLFGNVFVPAYNVNYYSVVAKTDCEITLIDHDRLMNTCEKSCESHRQLINNMVINNAGKSLVHIDILSQRTIREKLITYFKYLSVSRNTNEFQLPLSLSDLSNYISADRSAMMRELRKLNDESIISSRSNKITLLKEL